MARSTITVRLPLEERRLVEIAATAQEVGPSTYIRRAALEAARRDVLRKAVRDAS